MANKLTFNKIINSYLPNYNDTLGINQFNGLLAKKNKGFVNDKSTPIVHNDDAVDDKYYNYHGVYYVNYANIYNTLNRNIGGSSYMSQNYDILDEGGNVGQREGIVFEGAERPTPTFLSDKERDSYFEYIKYITDVYGTPTYFDTSIKDENKKGYLVGAKRTFEIDGTINPNGENDSILGKLSSKILSNIVFSRNIRREEKGFPSITNINYYGKGRTDIEESNNIESLDTAIGFSSDGGRPEFGIKNSLTFIGFNDSSVEYSYSDVPNMNYSLFDRWGELSNGTISLTNSIAYNSIKKSAMIDTDMGNMYLSADKTLDMSMFLLNNLKYKGNFNGLESFVTYFGKHNFSISIEDYEAKNRYRIESNSRDENVPRHTDFHYDEGRLYSDYETANGGTNHGKYLVSDSVGVYGKDLLNVANNAFRNAKYDTIISKFCTQHQGDFDDKFGRTQTAVSHRFGMSHGRNLLKVNRNEKGDAISVNTDGGNGYDNPYCRVWTYHHQYSTFCDLIRPFTTEDSIGCRSMDGSGNRMRKEIAKHRRSTISKDSNNYKKFSDEFKVYQSDGEQKLIDYSVLNRNGLVNITPTDNGVPEYRTKVENCMFSIENLAWKDIYKGTFSNISTGQTGPNGGRIMWFPPYGLTFNENVSANWNPVSFIGRGENIYTYTNTERSGSLSFILLIDHPSVVNEWRNEKKFATQDVDDIDSNEQRILRFFAGCELLSPLDERPVEQNTPQPQPLPKIEFHPIVPITPPQPKKGKFSFIVYYPNNYSGVDDTPEQAISYLLNGVMFGEDADGNYQLTYQTLDNEYSISGESFLGGYEMNVANYGISTPTYSKKNGSYSGKTLFYPYKKDDTTSSATSKNKRAYVVSQEINISANDTEKGVFKFIAPYSGNKWSGFPKYQSSWGYRVDEKTFKQNLRMVSDTNSKYNNYTDCGSIIGTTTCTQNALNSTGYQHDCVKHHFSEYMNDRPFYSFADVFAALMPEYEKTYCLNGKTNDENIKDIRKFINYGISKITIFGSASIQGNYKGSALNSEPRATKNTANDNLSHQRAKTIENWLKTTTYIKNSINNDIIWDTDKIIERGVSNNGGGTDAIDMKVTRCAIVTIEYDESISLNTSESQNTEYINELDSEGNLIQTSERKGDPSEGTDAIRPEELEKQEVQAIAQDLTTRYDNEEEFFRDLKFKDPFLHNRIVDKIKYFDPVFHSITPEGFASRLTFLQQCTRQGNTIGASDAERRTASNLSFGRPPVCVLRIGDFYNTKIIIESLNISYENGSGIQWDLNPEGVGVMPMYAKVDISFKFLGGSDLQGPISRLQNALSFNYYANTGVYDNRSDVFIDDERKILKPWFPTQPNEN